MKTIFIVTLSWLALVAGAAVVKAPASAQHDSTRSFLIGTLKADGTLIPFAQFGYGGWWNPWPKPPQPAESIYAETTETEVLHNSLADLSEPWFNACGTIPNPWFFSSSAGTSTLLNAYKVVKVEAHSGTNWALLTDFPKRTSEDPLHDVIGVAVTVKQEIDPFIAIDIASAEGKDVGSFVKDNFDGDETAEIDRLRKEKPIADSLPLAFSLSADERVKVKMSLTALYRTRSVVNGEHVYYFEAEKHYQKPPTARDAGCYEVSLFQGWILKREKSGFAFDAGQLLFTDCDRKGPSTMIPMATMKLMDQVFLFVREHGWESESYIILDLTESGLHRVLQTDGA